MNCRLVEPSLEANRLKTEELAKILIIHFQFGWTNFLDLLVGIGLEPPR